MSSHSTLLPRPDVEYSPGTKVKEAFTTYICQHSDEKVLRKDIELDKLQAENERMKRERVEQIADKNLDDFHSNIRIALL